MEDIRRVASLELPWEKLKNKSIMLSGATGMIGSFLIDVIMERNYSYSMNTTIYALGRDEVRARNRFDRYFGDSKLRFISHDIKKSLNDIGLIPSESYILHLASNTHPLQYSTDPIGTITTNILGLYNMLEYAALNNTSRFVFASSNEIYGENRGDVEFFSETYSGYIDSNTLRAGYPESKRCGEALCQAFRAEKGMDAVISRFTRTYGPTMLRTDTKAISQFINKALKGEDIVLKSSGEQLYSYTYVADAVSGLLYILLKGEDGEAYNIADEASDITLKELANLIAREMGQKVVFAEPESIEAAGYSVVTKARLDGSKLKKLGWSPLYSIGDGIARCMQIMK